MNIKLGSDPFVQVSNDLMGERSRDLEEYINILCERWKDEYLKQ